ncbi:MAG: hypothetical protein J6V94_08470, partial [Lachnospiraceae bacterium]|nr:hypothetical protein [Lachnospiraceae bacterium]
MDDNKEKDVFTTNADGRIRNQKRNPRLNNNYYKWGLTVFLTFLACMFAFYILFYNAQLRAGINRINKILSPVYVGFIIAYLFSPLLNMLENKVMYPLYKKIKFIKDENKMPLARGTSIIVIIIFSFFLVYAIVQIMLKQVIPSLLSIVSNISIYLDNLTKWANKLLQDNPDLNS